MAETNTTSALTTQRNELVKQYIEYDVDGRPEFIYSTLTSAGNGFPCTVVQYVYVAATTRVLKMKENNSVWDSTWDI